LKSPRIVLADDKHLNRREFLFQGFGDFQTIHGWHRNVEEYDIRPVFSYFVEGIGAVDSLANNLDVGLGIQNLADAAADALVIIYHEHTKCAGSHIFLYSLSHLRSKKNLTKVFLPREVWYKAECVFRG